MVRKLDLHEDAVFRYCGAAVAIMGFDYAASARPIPVFADRRLRVDEPPPIAGVLRQKGTDGKPCSIRALANEMNRLRDELRLPPTTM